MFHPGLACCMRAIFMDASMSYFALQYKLCHSGNGFDMGIRLGHCSIFIYTVAGKVYLVIPIYTCPATVKLGLAE